MHTPPAGFVPHSRKSPLTAPWEPIFAREEDERLSLGIRIAEAHCNGRGFVHGGLIAALADNAMGLTCSRRIEGAAGLLTTSLSVDYLGPGEIGDWLEVRPDVLKLGGRLAFAQCLVTADGRPCARTSASFAVARAKAA